MWAIEKFKIKETCIFTVLLSITGLPIPLILCEINGNRHPDRNEPEDPRTALLGITYGLSERITIETAIRRGLTSSTPDWGMTIGASITF